MQTAADSFHGEVQEVRAHIESAFTQLDSALRQFVRRDLAAAEPFPLAVVVLSAGLPPEDNPEVRRGRIFLAAALEMLRIALSIHEDLVAAPPDQAEKSMVGATILVGDYCFSRSASLAASTESPYVVEIFSTALKQVSEGRLRRLFSDDSQNPPSAGEQKELCKAGARAGAYLAGLSAPESQSLIQAAGVVGETLDRGGNRSHLWEQVQIYGVPRHQQARWQQALAYLSLGGETEQLPLREVYSNGSKG